MSVQSIYTAEHVACGHPDKFADQLADRILDEVLSKCGQDKAMRSVVRTAIECIAKDNVIFVSGESKWPDSHPGVDVEALVKEVWQHVEYELDTDMLQVLDYIQPQSAEIATGSGHGVDAGGAGDQGIMVGYATDETPEMMPREWVAARDICLKLHALRTTREIPWLGSDCKSQVTQDAEGRILKIIIAAQHKKKISGAQVREAILSKVVLPLFGDRISPRDVKINGTGIFVTGGPASDAGVVGRKIVVDAYGPRVAVGGGCYSGKDPTKVDRSAAYMARHIAKAAVVNQVKGARSCIVSIAYGIGQHQPEMLTATTNKGEDVSSWVREKFPDLSPHFIIEHLSLRNPKGWSYFETASYGHFGRSQFPWENVDSSL